MNRLFSLKFKRNLCVATIMMLSLFALSLFFSIFSVIKETRLIEEDYIYNNLFNFQPSSVDMVIKITLIIVSITIVTLLRENLDVLKAGVKGEKNAFKHIKALKKHGYKIISNVLIPKENGGFREADFIIIGPKGVFVIEAKNLSGCISGNGNDKKLSRTKYGKRGKSYTSSIDNPIKQVKGQVFALVSYLRKKDLRNYIDYIIAFTNDNSTINIYNDENKIIKMINSDAIINHLEGMKTNKILSKQEVDNVYNEISKLKLGASNILNPSFIIGCIKDDFSKLKNKKITPMILLDWIREMLISMNGFLIFTLVIFCYWMMINFWSFLIVPGIWVLTDLTAFDMMTSVIDFSGILLFIADIASTFLLSSINGFNSFVILGFANLIVFISLKLINIPYKLLKLEVKYF